MSEQQIKDLKLKYELIKEDNKRLREFYEKSVSTLEKYEELIIACKKTILNLNEAREQDRKAISKIADLIKNPKQSITNINLQGVNRTDELWSRSYDKVILKSIIPEGDGFLMTFYDVKRSKEETEWVSSNAEFYFDENGLDIEDDTY